MNENGKTLPPVIGLVEPVMIGIMPWDEKSMLNDRK
jgi:hypothetical protein